MNAGVCVVWGEEREREKREDGSDAVRVGVKGGTGTSESLEDDGRLGGLWRTLGSS